MSVRFLTGATHPDHKSICKFSRENKDLLSRARALQAGDITVAISGTNSNTPPRLNKIIHHP